jgi:uncharacterized protein
VRRVVVVVGKAPRPGQSKTRLSPPLTLEQAARLAGGFLQDAAATALGVGWGPVTVIYPPDPEADQELDALLPTGVRLMAQPGTGLGAALTGAFQAHFREGFERVVLISSDNPTLPAALVERAGGGLDNHDLVIGPSTDGGYYLIGMDRPHLGVFEQITWSTDVVFAETMERARERGLRVLVLREWYDVDTVAELDRLREELATAPPDVAPATRRLLVELG